MGESGPALPIVSSIAVDGYGHVHAEEEVQEREKGAHRCGLVGYHDIIGFVCGPAEIGLTAAWFSRQVEPQTERRLLKMLYRRASAARSEV